jgi:hypothetical protein
MEGSMSNEEHLIENALIEFRHVLRGEKEYEQARSDFVYDEKNKWMGEKSLTNLDTVWAMANYVIYDWCEGQDVEAVLDKLAAYERKGWVNEDDTE